MLEEIIFFAENKMTKSIDSLSNNLANIVVDRVNTSLIKNIKIEYFGEKLPIEQLAVLSIETGNILLVKPFDKKNVPLICKKIVDLNLDLNPFVVNDYIRVVFPKLTYEKRVFFAKEVKRVGEKTKIAIRHIRRHMNQKIKTLLKGDKISKGEEILYLSKIQIMSDDYIKKINVFIEKKEKNLLTF